jgi:hypothetical protein
MISPARAPQWPQIIFPFDSLLDMKRLNTIIPTTNIARTEMTSQATFTTEV